jgi:hypothetical protein
LTGQDGTFLWSFLGDVFVNIDDLKKFHESIVRFYHATNADPRKIVLSFGAEDGLVEGKMAFILPFISTKIGSHTFGCLVALVGLPIHLGEKQYQLNPDQLNIGSLMVKKDGNFTDQDLEGNISDFVKKMAEDGINSIIARGPDRSGIWPSVFQENIETGSS